MIQVTSLPQNMVLQDGEALHMMKLMSYYQEKIMDGLMLLEMSLWKDLKIQFYILVMKLGHHQALNFMILIKSLNGQENISWQPLGAATYT